MLRTYKIIVESELDLQYTLLIQSVEAKCIPYETLQLAFPSLCCECILGLWRWLNPPRHYDTDDVDVPDALTWCVSLCFP